MNKKIFKWVVILLVTFVLVWLLLKAVSVKETKVITSKNTYDILNNPHVSKVSDYISALMNHNHEKEKFSISDFLGIVCSNRCVGCCI